MKITFIKDDLVDAISKVSSSVATKADVPALTGILLTAKDKVLTLTGYDLEIGVKATITDVIIQEEGDIVISAKLLNDLVKKAKDFRVTLVTDKKFGITVTSGKSKFKLIGMSPNEYPSLPSVEEEESFILDGKTIKGIVSETAYANSSDTTKPIYTGSLFQIENKTLTVVAVDGYRMAIVTEPVSEEINTSLVIPGKSLKTLVRLISDKNTVRFSAGKRFISFSIENYTVYSRIIEGTFLDYKQTIPKECKTTVTMKTNELTEAIERLSLVVANEKVKSPVRVFVSEKGILKLNQKTSMADGEDELEVKVEGENVEIGFNNQFLLDALKSIESDEIKLSFNGSLAPMTITPVNSDAQLALVVPMRMS
ncbi:MAG: DNA polymerase III subunit beta [Ruminococcus sp.]|nr:DNA polymerase III subunit beta [Ruminococcus sp.]